MAHAASVRECVSYRLAAGEESVFAPRALRAGGLAPAGMPVADSLSAMWFIADSAIRLPLVLYWLRAGTAYV